MVEALDAAGIRAGLTGGWGIDALLGRQTRPHRDADLGVPARSIDDAVSALSGLGYVVIADEGRLDWSWSPRPAVDLHPIGFDAAGHGIQRGLDGERFDYPPGSLDLPGPIDRHPVRCGTPELQVAFHAHYDPRPHDIADMQALASAFGLELPLSYPRHAAIDPPIDDRGAA